jgi:polyisoprenoid-binding protein YceI
VIRSRLAIALGAVLMLAACGGAPQATPPPASSPLTQPRPSTSTSASPLASAPASTSASPQTPASSPSQPGAVKLTIASNSSQMDIVMHELLTGNAAKTNAVESTKAVSGAIMLDAQDNILPGSKLSLDVNSLQSDRQIRDGFIKRVTLQANQFPTVDFVPTHIEGLTGGLPSSGQRTFKLIGDATVRGATHPMTWEVTATFTGQGCEGTATAPLKLSDFGLTPPKAGPVIAVDDAGTIDLKFQASKSAM